MSCVALLAFHLAGRLRSQHYDDIRAICFGVRYALTSGFFLDRLQNMTAPFQTELGPLEVLSLSATVLNEMAFGYLEGRGRVAQ